MCALLGRAPQALSDHYSEDREPYLRQPGEDNGEHKPVWDDCFHVPIPAEQFLRECAGREIARTHYECGPNDRPGRWFQYGMQFDS